MTVASISHKCKYSLPGSFVTVTSSQLTCYSWAERRSSQTRHLQKSDWWDLGNLHASLQDRNSQENYQTRSDPKSEGLTPAAVSPPAPFPLLQTRTPSPETPGSTAWAATVLITSTHPFIHWFTHFVQHRLIRNHHMTDVNDSVMKDPVTALTDLTV